MRLVSSDDEEAFVRQMLWLQLSLSQFVYIEMAKKSIFINII